MGVTSIPLVLPISVYGGYFGAGAGTLLLGVLTIATEGDYRSANVAKNLVSSLNTLAARCGSSARRGELAADPGDDGGLPDRRLLRRAPGAPRAARVHARGSLSWSAPR